MSKEIEEAINQMTPQELAALEGELDKRASEEEASRLYSMGVKMASDAVAQFNETGEISPVLALVKAASDAAAPSEIDRELDKMSADELSQLEAELDKKANDDLSAQYAANYLEIGRKMAREHYSGMTKSAGRVAGGFLASAGRAFKGMAYKNPIGTALGAAAIGAVAAPTVGRILGGNRD